MSMGKRYQVLIGLHESRVIEARRLIGQLEQRFQIENDTITNIEAEQSQAALHVNHLMHEQYVHYCTHLQRKIIEHQRQKNQITVEIESAWQAMNEAQQELDVFRNLQQRQCKKEQIVQKRLQQRATQDFALMKWLEAQS